MCSAADECPAVVESSTVEEYLVDERLAPDECLEVVEYAAVEECLTDECLVTFADIIVGEVELLVETYDLESGVDEPLEIVVVLAS